MKRFFIVALLFLSIAACQNQNAEKAAAENTNLDPATAPVFSFEQESFDFGEITEGDTVTHNFNFTNTGKGPLIISNATATCGCTIPEYPKEPIAPGDKGTIHVVFNSAGKSGMQNKIITITANTVSGSQELHLIGNVKTKNN